MYGILEVKMNMYFHTLDGRIIAFDTPNEAQQYANAFYTWAIPQAMTVNPMIAMNIMNSYAEVRELPQGVNFVMARDL